MSVIIQNITNKIPEFCMSHWLIRIPLIVVFLQQGFDKWPIDADTAAGFELTLLVWTFVVLGEIGAGLGLFVGGVLSHFKTWVKELGDLITRFSGIVITGITFFTACVIWCCWIFSCCSSISSRKVTAAASTASGVNISRFSFACSSHLRFSIK